MDRNKKILIITLFAVIIVSTVVIVQKNKQSDLDGNQNITINDIEVPNASSSPEQIGNYVRVLANNAQATNSISILNDCEPDVKVAKISPDSKITFINTTNLVREISFDNNASYVLNPGESLIVAPSDLFPSASLKTTDFLAKAYACKGRSGPVGFILYLPIIEQ